MFNIRLCSAPAELIVVFTPCETIVLLAGLNVPARVMFPFTVTVSVPVAVSVCPAGTDSAPPTLRFRPPRLSVPPPTVTAPAAVRSFVAIVTTPAELTVKIPMLWFALIDQGPRSSSGCTRRGCTSLR